MGSARWWSTAGALGVLMLLPGACGDSGQSGGAPAIDAGGGAAAGQGAAGGSAGSTGSGATGGGGPSFAEQVDCSHSGACALVGCDGGMAAVSLDALDAFMAAGCPPNPNACQCAVLDSGTPDWPAHYAVCLGGSLCAVANDPPAPPEGGVCPATAPTGGQACNTAARCEYDDDPRPACRTLFDCSGGAAAWRNVAPACPQVVACSSGQVAGAACAVPDSACTASDGSTCVCGAVQGATANTWQCVAANTAPGCPPQPPRLGQACSDAGLCCAYGDPSLPAGDPASGLLVARTCTGKPAVWIEAVSSCL